jgi:hypothetical protein
MEKELPPPGNAPSKPSEKSFSVAFEQMAKFLRTEVKLKDRSTRILSSDSLPASFNNSLKQIARMLRLAAHMAKPLKKRSWKKHRTKP